MRGSNGRTELRVASIVIAAGHVGDPGQVPGADQGVGQQGGADLRAVDEGETLLGLQLVRREMDASKGRPTTERLGPAAGRGVRIGSRTANEGMAFADHDQGQMCERGQVAAGADAALLRNRRHDAAVVDGDQGVDQLRRNAGVSLGQRLDAKATASRATPNGNSGPMPTA